MLKDGIIAQQKATNVTKESSIFWLLQVAHTLLYTSLQPKGLKTDTDTEQQGGNWVEQTLRITQPNPNSLKSVKKPTSEKSELSPQRIRRSGSVQ